jgi:hypothetical protein
MAAGAAVGRQHGIVRAGVDAFAGATETGQVRPELADEGQIQSATLEMAGSGVGRGDLRSPARQAGPSAERQSEPARAVRACRPECTFNGTLVVWNRRHTTL